MPFLVACLSAPTAGNLVYPETTLTFGTSQI